MSDKKLISKPELKIEKIKLTAQGMNVEATEVFIYDDESTAEESYERKYKREPHPDLIEAFKQLATHLAAICRCDASFVEVTGIRIDALGTENARGLVTGKVLAFDNQKTSINTHYLNLETTAYSHRKELHRILSECENEVRLYMLTNKTAQPTLWEQGFMKVA